MRAQLVAFLAVAGSAWPASAQEPDWTVGAGVTAVSIGPRLVVGGSAQLGTPSSIVSSSLQPAFGFFLERRLAPAAWLLVQGLVNYQSAVDEIDPDLVEVTTAQVAAGPRFVLNPGGIVEVSAFVLAGGAYSYLFQRSQAEIGPTPQRQEGKATAWSAGATAGLILERELVSRLALRFSVGVLAASYTRVTSRVDLAAIGDLSERKQHAYDFGLRFSPGLELRLAF